MAFGVNNQKRKFNEESFEFIEAVTRWENNLCWIVDDQRVAANIKASITEELADCLVLLRQFAVFFNIPEDEIEKMVNFKIERTLKRMNDGEEKDNTGRVE